MDRKALYDLSYGVFLLSAKAGDRVNGCITNTCIQVASSPVRVAFSVLNGNLTCEVLKEGGVFCLTVLDQSVTPETIRHFGAQSGRDVDKFKELQLTARPAEKVGAPLIAESPVNIECKVRQVLPLGSHDMFLADVVAVHADEKYMDEKKKFHLEWAEPVVYSHGTYFMCGEPLGTFGYSIKKEKRTKAAKPKKKENEKDRK